MMHQLRSLEFWASLCSAGVNWPETRCSAPDKELADWLIKPRQSGGGLGVIDARAMQHDGESPGTHYWQRRITGRGLGITWLISDRAQRVLGVTETLSSKEWPGPTEHMYRGSFGPIRLAEGQLNALAELGSRLSKAVPNYRGLLQADVIEDAHRDLWLLELNPRWTSGMEVLHRASRGGQDSPLRAHLDAWGIASSGRSVARMGRRAICQGDLLRTAGCGTVALPAAQAGQFTQVAESA